MNENLLNAKTAIALGFMRLSLILQGIFMGKLPKMNSCNYDPWDGFVQGVSGCLKLRELSARGAEGERKVVWGGSAWPIEPELSVLDPVLSI